MIYEFGEQTVTVTGLSIATKRLAKNMAKIEVLGTTLSPNAGYRSLRVEPLRASGNSPQSFRFEPVAARWVMVRVSLLDSKADALTMTISDVALKGYEGIPRRPTSSMNRRLRRSKCSRDSRIP